MEFLEIKNCVVIKKAKCKNSRISVKQDGSVIVSVPYFYTKEQSLKILESHYEWIKKSLEKIKLSHLEVQDFFATHPNEILFFGKWIKYSSQINVEYLKKELLNYLRTRTTKLAAQMDLKYNKISVRGSKTRLGSCSYQNNLSFSLLLVFASERLIDYVIIHELSHIVHKNHSKNFWSLVEKFCPQHKEKRRELHKNIKFYTPMLEKILSSPLI